MAQDPTVDHPIKLSWNLCGGPIPSWVDMPCHDNRALQTCMARSAMQPSGAPMALRRADTSGAYKWQLAAVAIPDWPASSVVPLKSRPKVLRPAASYLAWPAWVWKDMVFVPRTSISFSSIECGNQYDWWKLKKSNFRHMDKNIETSACLNPKSNPPFTSSAWNGIDLF